ncbi:hypothetical protein Q7C36_001590 [Tachysurus vachellii]|uniref:Uncharacterized protein n=1 Tax=Tachysurus vachellii TaxID=175792 RepID=A0AA88T834_TACVA|nr:hypothetical protein Q7C36_001590 [Tachysurus vachellii]
MDWLDTAGINEKQHLVPGREAETWTRPEHIRHCGSGLLRDTKKIDVLSLAAHILCELIRVTRQLRQEAEVRKSMNSSVTGSSSYIMHQSSQNKRAIVASMLSGSPREPSRRWPFGAPVRNPELSLKLSKTSHRSSCYANQGSRFYILKNMIISNSLQLELPLALSVQREIEGESEGERERGKRKEKQEESFASVASRKRFSFPSDIFRPPTRSWREKQKVSQKAFTATLKMNDETLPPDASSTGSRSSLRAATATRNNFLRG